MRKVALSRKALMNEYNNHIVPYMRIASMEEKKYCFFTGKEIKNGVFDPHHTKGRDNDNLVDKEYLVYADHWAHMNYHADTVEHNLEREWYPQFLLRLYSLDEKLYRKELYKQVKSDLITLEEYVNIVERQEKCPKVDLTKFRLWSPSSTIH